MLQTQRDRALTYATSLVFAPQEKIIFIQYRLPRGKRSTLHAIERADRSALKRILKELEEKYNKHFVRQQADAETTLELYGPEKMERPLIDLFKWNPPWAD